MYLGVSQVKDEAHSKRSGGAIQVPRQASKDVYSLILSNNYLLPPPRVLPFNHPTTPSPLSTPLPTTPPVPLRPNPQHQHKRDGTRSHRSAIKHDSSIGLKRVVRMEALGGGARAHGVEDGRADAQPHRQGELGHGLEDAAGERLL